MTLKSLRVAVSGPKHLFPLLERQSPGRSWRWGKVQFVPDARANEVDAWVIFDSIEQPTTLSCPPENVYYLSGEPESVRSRYDRRFLDQFSLLIGARGFGGRASVRTQPMIPWHFGWSHRTGEITYTYDDLRTLRYDDVVKAVDLSAVTSGKSHTSGHRDRIELLKGVASHLPTTVETRLYGRDSIPVDDKAEAILPAQFHLAIENSRFADYWTEKFADAVLGWSIPIYFGASNIANYFPPRSFIDLPSVEPLASLESIKSAITAGVSGEAIDALAEARRLVLDVWNFFPAMARIVLEHRVAARPAQVRVTPERPSVLRAVGGRISRTLTRRS